MLQMTSFPRTLFVLLVLSVSVFPFTPSQDSAAQKTEARKRIVRKNSTELEAAATTRVEPVVPPVARWAGIGGSVNVSLLINEQGDVIEAKADYGPPLLQNAAAVAARGWKFKPAEADGTPVKVNGLLLLHFPVDTSVQAAPGESDDLAKAKAAVLAFPTTAEAFYWLGMEYADADEPQGKEAEKALNRAIEIKSDYEEAYAKLVAMYKASKSEPDVLRVYQQAVDKIPDSLAMRTGLARALHTAKRYEESLDLAKRAIEINGDDMMTRYLLTADLIMLNRLDEALAEMAEELKIDPDSMVTYENLGATYYRMKRYDEAVAAYQHVIKNKPDYYNINQVYHDMALAQLQAGQATEAVNSMNQAIELKKDTPDTYCMLGIAYERAGQMNAALDALKKGIQERPTESCTYSALGTIQARKGNMAEAEPLFRKAAELNPNQLATSVNLVSVLLAQKKNADAELVLRQSLKRNPDDVNLHVFAGSTLAKLGKSAESDAELREALRRDPNNALALNDLGYYMAERGEKLNEALELVQRAVNAAPDNASYLDSLGYIYFKLGRLDEAERYLTRASQGSRKSVAIFEHLGDLYEKQGKHDLALGAWQKALSFSASANDSNRLKAKLSGEPPKEKETLQQH